jgi:hypothetical protein
MQKSGGGVFEWQSAIERAENIDEGMNTTNMALNVSETLRVQDYVTSFIKAMDVYMTSTKQLVELKVRKL